MGPAVAVVITIIRSPRRPLSLSPAPQHRMLTVHTCVPTLGTEARCCPENLARTCSHARPLSKAARRHSDTTNFAPSRHATGISLPDFASRMVGTSLSAVLSSPMSVIRTLIQVSSRRPPPKLAPTPHVSVLSSSAFSNTSRPQLGHEPIAPKPHVNFIGQNGFLRPGMIKYGKELVSTHGYKALFVGIEVCFGPVWLDLCFWAPLRSMVTPASDGFSHQGTRLSTMLIGCRFPAIACPCSHPQGSAHRGLCLGSRAGKDQGGKADLCPARTRVWRVPKGGGTLARACDASAIKR